MARMMTYAWFDTNHDLKEPKFGDHFIPEDMSIDDARQNTLDYMRTQFPRRGKYFDSNAVLKEVWDVSEVAKKHKKFAKGSHIDDLIGQAVGFRGTAQGREFHDISFDELVYRVNEFLKKFGQPLPKAGLSQNQYTAAENVIDAVTAGKRTIVAELCARFGKTIWSGALIRETNAELTIVASYVLTSFTSFKKDLSAFGQFSNFELIDAGEPDWEIKIQEALEQKKQTVTFLSMCAGGRRQDKINTLFAYPVNRLVIVDEADFGVHQVKQSQPLIEARGEDDVVILMTGTNGDKAASVWPVDHYLSVTYPELLIEKHQDRLGTTSLSVKSRALRHFDVGPSRHQLYVDVEFYQMDLASIIEIAKTAEPDAFIEDGIFLPSWSKFAANPVKAKGFFTNMLQAVFEGKGGDDSLNVDYQTGRRAREGTKVAMMFLPGSTTNANLEEIIPIAEQALRGFDIIAVYGEEMTNATAEHKVKERIERAEQSGQHVLILSAGMAQRSFSIPQITELYLAYDTGDNGATIQKMSRALTPYTQGKIGRVISLSFDPNRDDKFDSMLIETAQNYKRNHKIPDLKQALRDVLRTVDIFKCQPSGSVKVEVDEYLEAALSRNSIDRVIGKVTNVREFSKDMISALIDGNVDVFRSARQAAAQKGKTKLIKIKRNKNTSGTDASEKDLARAREMIVTIAQNIDIIKFYGGKTIEDAFALMDRDGKGIQDDVTRQFGVDYEMIKELILGGIINRDLLDLKFA